MEHDDEAPAKRGMAAEQESKHGLPTQMRLHHNRPGITHYYCAHRPRDVRPSKLCAGMPAAVREQIAKMTFRTTEMGGCLPERRHPAFDGSV